MRCEGMVSAATRTPGTSRGGWSRSSVCWILKPISTSCSRARASSSCARLRSVMSSEMPTRYFGVPSAPSTGHFDGVQIAETPMRGLDSFLGNFDHPPAVQHGAVLRHEEVGLLFGKEIVVASSDCRAAIDAERLFLRSVPANELQVLGVFHEEHDRQVLEHRVQETPRIFELCRALGQRFFHPLLFGQILLTSWLGARGSGLGSSRAREARDLRARTRGMLARRLAALAARPNPLTRRSRPGDVSKGRGVDHRSFSAPRR